jgi:hypothetical protein
MVKSVQHRVRDNPTWSVETMSLALQRYGTMRGRLGQAGPQGRVWSAAIVMQQPEPQSFAKMLLGQGNHPIQTLPPKGPDEPFAECIGLRALHWVLITVRPRCAAEVSNPLEKIASWSWRIKR